jgi:radical SAM superfamily enzyme YgiQ (UPF0313 family)
MAVIAGALQERGHRVEQFDLLSAGGELSFLEELVDDFRPEFVCLSLRNLDNVDSLSGVREWYLDRDREVVRTLRRLTAVPIILGGAAFSLMPEAVLDYLKADYGIVGEGERALCELLERLAAGRPVPERLIRGEPIPEGRDFGSPVFTERLRAFYFDESGIAGLQTKRGCPYGCVYCSYPELEGHRFRYRPVETVVEEIAGIVDQAGPLTLFFVDSVFNDPGGYHLELAEAILRRSVKVQWSAFFRPDGISRGELALLQRSGLFALELGSDALTEPTLAGLGKGFTLDDIFATHDNCRALGLAVAHYIIFGGPGETDATLDEGLRNLDRLEQGVIFPFSGLRLLPGTRLYRRALREGVITSETSLLQPVYYFSPAIDPAAMNRRIAAACKGRRERLFPPAEAFSRMAVMRRFGSKGLLWDKLIASSSGS